MAADDSYSRSMSRGADIQIKPILLKLPSLSTPYRTFVNQSAASQCQKIILNQL